MKKLWFHTVLTGLEAALSWNTWLPQPDKALPLRAKNSLTQKQTQEGKIKGKGRIVQTVKRIHMTSLIRTGVPVEKRTEMHPR